MKKNLIVALLFFCINVFNVVNTYAFPYFVNTAAINATNVTAWLDFNWTVDAGSDQTFVFHTDQQGIAQVVLRLTYPAGETNYTLQWVSSDVSLTSTGTLFQGYLSRTNIPPVRNYYAQFYGVLGTNVGVDAGMTIGKGRFNVTWSQYTDTNTWTNLIVYQTSNGNTNETDPAWLNASTSVYSRLTDLEGYTNRSAEGLKSSVWANANSTTNSTPYTEYKASTAALWSAIGGGGYETLTNSLALSNALKAADVTLSNGLQGVIDTKIASTTASNNFYLASNPSNYQSGAQVATQIAGNVNGFMTGTASSNSFFKLDGDPDEAQFANTIGLTITNANGNQTLIAVRSSTNRLGINSGDTVYGGYFTPFMYMWDGGGAPFTNGYLVLGWNQLKTSFVKFIYTNGPYIVWDSNNDGSGSGLDADLLDGISSAGFVTTNGNANGLTNFPSSLSTIAQVQSTSNQIGVASNAIVTRFDAANLATTNRINGQGDVTSNQITRLNGLGDVVTNQITRLNGVGDVVTNTQNMVSTGLVEWADATNFYHSQTATNLPNSYTNLGYASFTSNGTYTAIRIGQYLGEAISRAIDFIHIGDGSGWTNGLIAKRYSTGIGAPYWINNGTTNLIHTELTFDQNSYLGVTDAANIATNYLKIYHVAAASSMPTQNQVGTKNAGYLFTNTLVISLGGTNWLTINGIRGP